MFLKGIAYSLLLVPPLYTLSQYSPRAKYYLRLSTYLGCFTAVATWGAFVAASMAMVGRKYDVDWVIARTFYYFTGSLLGVEVVVEMEGEADGMVGAREADRILDQTKPAVIMMNHQSMLDILIVGRLFPKRGSIVSKAQLKFSPVGPFMLLSGAVFIDRSNNNAAVASLREASKTINTNKLSLWMFPEGTRTMREEPDMIPLKKGGFHLAIQSGMPIVPVVAENYWRLYRKGVFDEGKIRVRVLKPIPTTGLTEADAGALAQRVREVMVEALREISIVPESSLSSSQPTPLSASREQTPAPPPSRPDHLHAAMPILDDPTPSNMTMTPDYSDHIRTPSSASLSSYEHSGTSSSEHGTEEDEDMVLVPRPAA